jgi:hypothetical protein
MESRTPEYWAWIKEEAQKAGSDGCTHALEIRVKCCWEHDLAYFYGRDPRDAYRISIEYPGVDPWESAAKISKVSADLDLGRCSKLWWRVPAVLLGGLAIWRKKRKVRS